MRRLTFARPHRLGKLHDELLAAVPTLRPVVRQDRENVAVMTISGDGQTLTLAIPDDADDAAIEAVVAAHDATTPSTTEAQQTQTAANDTTIRQDITSRLQTMRDLAAKVEANTATAAEQRQLLALVARGQIRLARLSLNQLDATG